MVRKSPERGPTFNHTFNIPKKYFLKNLKFKKKKKKNLKFKYEKAVILSGSKFFSVDRKGFHLS